MGMIEEAQAAGGTLLLEPKRNGCLIEPTVIAGVSRDARVVQEEVFGPVGVRIKVDTVEEAIMVANDCEFGLQASCFTGDLESAFRGGGGGRAGAVWRNGESGFRSEKVRCGKEWVRTCRYRR